MATHHALGIDIGGSGIKGAPVDLDKGRFTEDRLRIATPEEATPDAVCDIVEQIAQHFSLDTDVPLGITLPAVVTHGVVCSAANIDRSWVDLDADTLFGERLGRPIHLVNDADAAGVAELHHGAAKGHKGLVVLTTLGTGIGSALIMDGVLVPNTELGHLEIDGYDAETRAAESVRDREGLDWQQWAQRLQTYYARLESLLRPDLIVVGGGVSKQADQFLPLLDLRTEIVPAKLRNKAGIIGAAHLAARGN
ncbi:polyphosphate--glucose phosphotransferase [Janibacter cremeus]|uniref:Polyphosphate glucokinase n=1 Tax=Janibacter cremeus TaxID=1285192 RepID=A0A852W1G6_9MICO|nr:ROK family protein [Janibacter cremeus]NYF99481.1 polyphosphate glucokinase [Janibacter cremeus]